MDSRCLFQFKRAVSPHIAVRDSFAIPRDSEILSAIQRELAANATSNDSVTLLETAGGVLSPALSGIPQADFYRPLRLPVLLVADHKLGGIGVSISAFESLRLRGYDIDSVVVFKDDVYENYAYIQEYLESHNVQTIVLPEPPERNTVKEEDDRAMLKYFDELSQSPVLDSLIDSVSLKHQSRLQDLESMAKRSDESIWHPFTQHQTRAEKDIMTIDSAYGDFFQTLNSSTAGDSEAVLRPTYDGSASWWTQGLGHGNPDLSLTAAHAAGRYGHVMFANAVHEPALLLAETLLENSGNSRLKKVFYTDNGSTGTEVAVKMALNAASRRYGWESNADDIKILGLKGSYHGDTIGAMDCSEPSAYNKVVHWYSGKGVWLDFPQVKMRKGEWVVESPAGMEDGFGPPKPFQSLSAIFDLDYRDPTLYEAHISRQLEQISAQGIKLGALMMEPIILGAGGMLLIDPLFQQTLIKIVRSSTSLISPGSSSRPSDPETWTGLPVIHDEVFTGLYRLGAFTSSSFLNVDPDISVHAKLLTGGLVPLAVTLASQSIFDSFLGDQKAQALLHGHSYTAHAVGCEVARKSVQTMMDMEKNGAWSDFQSSWLSATSGGRTNEPWSMWSQDFVSQVSHLERVHGVVTLGSVLAVELKDEGQGGYSSNVANDVQRNLMNPGPGELSVHSRVLGNVIYFMTSQTAALETVRTVERRLFQVLS